MEYRVHIFHTTQKYLNALSEVDRSMIARDMQYLATNKITDIQTKQLHGPVRELIVGRHRITYFILNDVLYCAHGFQKKSNKTPQRIIEHAVRIYKMLQSP